ncbi:MAG: hypothetical protein ACE5GW_11155 [Planctomycetota bacterium]
MILPFLLLLPLSQGSACWEVTLTNGHRQRVLEARHEGEVYHLRFREGTITVLATEVTSVRECAGGGVTATATAPSGEGESRPLAVGPLRLRYTPAPLFRGREAQSSGEGRIVTFESEGGRESLRLAWGGAGRDLWAAIPGIRAHHRRTYPRYLAVAERFTSLEGRPAWLLSYRFGDGGERRWECQGFLVLDEGMLVITATVTEESQQNPELLVRASGHRIGSNLDGGAD